MSDFTLCTGNCPISEYCSRHIASSNGETRSSLEGVCLPNNYSELIPYNMILHTKSNNKKGKCE